MGGGNQEEGQKKNEKSKLLELLVAFLGEHSQGAMKVIRNEKGHNRGSCEILGRPELEISGQKEKKKKKNFEHSKDRESESETEGKYQNEEVKR